MNASGRAAEDVGVLLYVHGGGFADSDPRAENLVAHRLSEASGRPVFALDYRLAPAHPYPAALDDVVTAHDVLIAGGAREVVLFGESAGGTLVLSALLALKAAGAASPPRTVAVSPITDLTLSSASLETADGGDLISRAVLEHVRGQYLAGAPADAAPQSPLHGDLARLPELLLAVGAAEVLADDARRFAEAAGPGAVLDVYEGMPHGYHLALLMGEPLPMTAVFLHRLADFVDGRLT